MRNLPSSAPIPISPARRRLPATSPTISTREQAGAGLASLSAEEFARFTALNEAYRARFGFPFIFAVKGATRQQILAAFAARLEHGPTAEFSIALEPGHAHIPFPHRGSGEP